jgi:basic membrane lipoprotein Med (substrate-binding protein (PBP1-ABC) superfamily)
VRKLKLGMVSDVGGLDEASFNENTCQSVVVAEEQPGICGQFIESQAQADYQNNITELAEQDYGLIITVGFLPGAGLMAEPLVVVGHDACATPTPRVTSTVRTSS